MEGRIYAPDKDMIFYSQDNLKKTNSPDCPWGQNVGVGSKECMNCKYCYGASLRLNDRVEEDGKYSYNAYGTGYVSCGRNSNKIIRILKRLIFLFAFKGNKSYRSYGKMGKF